MGFNPPPGWPLPQGWDPPPDWVPDPSWPPAPPGWQFWADDELAGPVPVGPLPTEPGPHRPLNLWPLALLAGVLIVVGGALGIGRLLTTSDDASQAPTVTEQADGGHTASVPDTSPPVGPTPSAQCSADATDVLGDTELMYQDRGEYNRSDIVALEVHCADEELTVTMTFAPAVDMAVAGFAALIDRDPAAGMQGGHACEGDSTEDFSISVDGGARDATWTVLDRTSCSTPYPVLARGSSTTVGSSLAATVPFADLGIRSGDTITLYAFSSTYLPPDLLDPGQDYIPDGAPLRIDIG